VTAEAAMALAGRPLPLAAVARQPAPVTAGARAASATRGRTRSRVAHPSRRAAAAAAVVAHHRSATPAMLELATGFAIATALALAPVGVS